MTEHSPDLAAPAPRTKVGELGYAPMDQIHAQFDALLEECKRPDKRDWVVLLAEIDAHMRSHFETEDQWMKETEFPPRDCHIDEHAAVLKSSSEVLALARAGDLFHAEPFVTELARWFPAHADYLDSALAVWMFKRLHGGRPVVLHRNPAS